MVWKATKDGSYAVRSNLDVLEGGKGAEPFSKKTGLEPVSSYRSRIFCVGSLVGQGFDFGSAKEKRILPC